MRVFLKLLMLRPHGRNLCSPKADMWLYLLRMNILLILTAEGLAWGFIGYLMGAQTSPWLGAALVGGVIVLLVGSVDAAFAMLDLTHIRAADSALPDEKANWRGNLRSFFKKYGKGARIGVVFRVGMVIASLLITSPFLAQLMFSTDIANLRNADYDQAVSHKRAAIETQFDRTLQGIQADRDRSASEYSREIAGKGLSGRFGLGPVARSLASRIDKLDQQLQAVKAQKESKLATFQNASPSTRAREFGVGIITDGIATRFEALGRMETIPGFRRAENAIRMILFGLFLGLLLLKWYEPRTLAIYLDEELQDAFQLYQAGAYDDWHDRTKFSPSKMTPFEFQRWYYKSEKVRAKTQEVKNKMAAISSRQAEIDATVHRLSESPGEDMLSLAKARVARMQEFEAAAEQVKKLEEYSSTVDAEFALCESELRNAANTIAEESRFSASVVLLKKQEIWEKRQVTARANQRLHSERLKYAVLARDAKAAELKRIDDVISAQNAMMAELASAAAEARRAAIRDLREAG